MPKFKKKVLEPGTYQSPDGEIVITPERINHWVNSFKEMKSSGLKLPLPWGHQSKAEPDYEEREFYESKYNAGFIDSFATDVNGALLAIVDVPREEDADRIGTIVQEVSPQVETSWRDGRGKVWSDVITHLALVTHPVVPGQENFEAVDSVVPTGATRLSLKQKLSNSTGEKKMAKEDEGAESTETVTEEAPVKKESKKAPKKAPEVEVEVEEGDNFGGGTSGGIDPELIDALAQVKLFIPDSTTSENLVDVLKAACLTLANSQGGAGAGDEGGADDLLSGLDLSGLEDAVGGEGEVPPEGGADAGAGTEEKPKGPLMEQQPSMSMSLNNKNYEDRLAMLSTKLEESDRTRMNNEIDLLLSQGKLTPVIASQLKGELKGYRLSLGANGTQEVSAVQGKIDAFKLMPEGSAWGNEERIRLRNIAEEALPSEFKNFSEDEATKIADGQLKAAGKTTVYQF